MFFIELFFGLMKLMFNKSERGFGLLERAAKQSETQVVH